MRTPKTTSALLSILAHLGNKSKASIRQCIKLLNQNDSLTYTISKSEILSGNTKPIMDFFTSKNRAIAKYAKQKVRFVFEGYKSHDFFTNKQFMKYIKRLTLEENFPWLYYCHPDDIATTLSIYSILGHKIPECPNRRLSIKIIEEYTSYQRKAITHLAATNRHAASFNIIKAQTTLVI